LDSLKRWKGFEDKPNYNTKLRKII